MNHSLPYTCLSLECLAGCLILAGLGLFLAPQRVLGRFGSSGDYGEVMPRFVGLVLLMLGITLAKIIRLNAVALFGTTLIIRTVAPAGILSQALCSHDPFYWG